jgi:hypothetical protein
LNGKSLGYASEWSGLYNGKRIWNLNRNGQTGSGVENGNFTIPLNGVRDNETLMIRVTIEVVDNDLNSPLPVGWIYVSKKNEWYYEPAT